MLWNSLGLSSFEDTTTTTSTSCIEIDTLFAILSNKLKAHQSKLKGMDDG